MWSAEPSLMAPGSKATIPPPSICPRVGKGGGGVCLSLFTFSPQLIRYLFNLYSFPRAFPVMHLPTMKRGTEPVWEMRNANACLSNFRSAILSVYMLCLEHTRRKIETRKRNETHILPRGNTILLIPMNMYVHLALRAGSLNSTDVNSCKYTKHLNSFKTLKTEVNSCSQPCWTSQTSSSGILTLENTACHNCKNSIENRKCLFGKFLCCARLSTRFGWLYKSSFRTPYCTSSNPPNNDFSTDSPTNELS